MADDYRNQIHRYARKILKTETARVHPTLHNDLQYMFNEQAGGGAVYLPNFFCKQQDLHIMNQIIQDLKLHEQQANMVQWSKHLKHENPEFSDMFRTIVQQMAEHFDVEVFATRLNLYPNGISWKPFHHDSHAYAVGPDGKSVKEDFTMGASFGHSRKLAFLHPESKEQFELPQNNGDVFAFDSEVNQRFQHGVPRVKTGVSLVGPRISIIAWGRRRNTDKRNSSSHSQPKRQAVPGGNTSREEGSGMDMAQVADLFARMNVSEGTSARSSSARSSGKSRSRVQGGWAR